jgi:hypothetical protein
MKIKLFIISALFLFTNCENVDVQPIGTVEGKVTIGPLCGIVPVGTTGGDRNGNPCGFSDEAMNKIYGEYKVVLSSTVTKTAIKNVVLNKTGEFKFEIVEGEYSVEVQKVDGSTIGIRQTPDKYLQTTKVTKNQTTKLEFSVDTGIR